MVLYFSIAWGGALGSVARFEISGLVANQIGATFPWGTFVVNVTGSFIIAFFATLTGPAGRIFASGNVVLSLVSCLVAVWLGHLAAATLNNLKGA